MENENQEDKKVAAYQKTGQGNSENEAINDLERLKNVVSEIGLKEITNGSNIDFSYHLEGVGNNGYSWKVYLGFYPKIQFYFGCFNNGSSIPEKVWATKQFTTPNQIDYTIIPEALAKVEPININYEMVKEKLPKKLSTLVLKAQNQFISTDQSTLDFLDEVLERNVKCDKMQRRLIIIGSASAYCPRPINIISKHETSTGKSYTFLEAVKLVPKEDVWVVAGASPKALIHKHGELDEDREAIVVDLRRKIILFLDQPSDQLLEALKPIMSHDVWESEFWIADRSKGSSLRTKKVILLGWPVIFFASVQQKTDPEIASRAILMSPDDSVEKVRTVLSHQTDVEKNRHEWEKQQGEDLGIYLARSLFQKIQQLGDKITISKPYLEEIEEKFVKIFPSIPIAMREWPRLVDMIDAITILNHESRDKVEHEDGVLEIISTSEDAKEAFETFQHFSKPLQYGITPACYEFYEKILKP